MKEKEQPRRRYPVGRWRRGCNVLLDEVSFFGLAAARAAGRAAGWLFHHQPPRGAAETSRLVHVFEQLGAGFVHFGCGSL